MLPNLTASIFDSSAMSRVIVPNGNVKKLKRASTKSFHASAYTTLLLSVHQNSQPNFVILKFSRIRVPVSYRLFLYHVFGAHSLGHTLCEGN